MHRRRGHRSSTCREAEKGSCMPFHVIIPAALVAGEAQRPPREEKSTVRTVATLPAELLYGLTKLPSSKPALPLSTRHRLLCPVLPVLPSYGPMFHFSQLKTEGGNARKSARRVCAWLGWLVTTAEGFEVYQRSYRRPTSVPSRNLREHLSIIPLLECRGPLWLAVGARGGTERSREAPCVALPGTYQVDG